MGLKCGFAKEDITPRLGVEMGGFGPYLNRRALAIRERLWARAMCYEVDGQRVLIISCDLIYVPGEIIGKIRAEIKAATGIVEEAILLHGTHTHSGPALGRCFGWGQDDEPYVRLLPYRIARAGIAAVEGLAEATVSHAEVACEGVGLNREYDIDAPPLEEVLQDDWRPAKPELTDTTCQVIKVEADGKVIGFASYFGCHPVVCCQATHSIHGDYAGVATNMLEREYPGSVGLFLQGAQGDVNSCVAHKPEKESLLALDVIAGRYAKAVREGLRQTKPLQIDTVGCALREMDFSRITPDVEKLRATLAEKQALFAQAGASDEDSNIRMATVHAMGIENLLRRLEAGEPLVQSIAVQGIRVGPISLLAAPFEIFQAIKNDVVARAGSPLPLVMGITNGQFGYAPDKTTAARGGYAAEQVPIMFGMAAFAAIHDELVEALLDIEKRLL